MPFEQAVARSRRFIRLLLIGDHTVGKTRSYLTFPGPIAVIDAEGGSDLFAEQFPHLRKETKSFTDTVALVDDVISGKIKVGTLVIDSYTVIYNRLQDAALGKTRDGALTQREWGIIKKNFRALNGKLYDKVPCHVVCTAWRKEIYAKPGSKIGDYIVKASDQIVVDETGDIDKKVMHAFDLALVLDMQKTPKADGGFDVRRFARVLKARGRLGEVFPIGSVIHNFSWDTLKPLFEGGPVVAGDGSFVMTDDEEEAERKDAALFDGPKAPTNGAPPAPPVREAVPFEALARLGEQLHDLDVRLGFTTKKGFWEYIRANIEPDIDKKKRLTPDQTYQVEALLKKQIAEILPKPETKSEPKDAAAAAAAKAPDNPEELRLVE